MSSIKPPSMQPGAPLAPEATAAEAIGSLSTPEAAEAARAAEAASGAGANAASDAIREIARALAGGTLSVEAAVAQLVERAVAPVALRLSEAERDELVALLRDALAHDPTLGSLRESLR